MSKQEVMMGVLFKAEEMRREAHIMEYNFVEKYLGTVYSGMYVFSRIVCFGEESVTIEYRNMMDDNDKDIVTVSWKQLGFEN